MSGVLDGKAVRQRKIITQASDFLDTVEKSPTVKKLSKFDLYPKTASHINKQTRSGGAVFVVTAIFMLFLFVSEFRLFLQTRRHDELSVDTSVGGTLTIYFNLTFPAAACNTLSVDVLDLSGNPPAHLRNRIFRFPADTEGRAVSSKLQHHKMKQEAFAASSSSSSTISRLFSSSKHINSLEFEYDARSDPYSPHYCGPCYTQAPTQQCCNTCIDVKNAISSNRIARSAPISSPEESDQCMREIEGNAVGCNVFGSVDVQKLPGNFHFAPGRSFMMQNHHGGGHVHEYDPMSMSFNASHVIHRLWFGEPLDGLQSPLEGVSKIVEAPVVSLSGNKEKKQDDGHGHDHNEAPRHDDMLGGGAGKIAGIYKYFVKVVPTSYSAASGLSVQTNQYSVTQHSSMINTRRQAVLPGVFIMYDLSPIRISYRETRDPFSHFLVKVCAVIGGLFSFSGLLDRIFAFVSDKMKANNLQFSSPFVGAAAPSPGVSSASSSVASSPVLSRGLSTPNMNAKSQ